MQRYIKLGGCWWMLVEKSWSSRLRTGEVISVGRLLYSWSHHPEYMVQSVGLDWKLFAIPCRKWQLANLTSQPASLQPACDLCWSFAIFWDVMG